MLSFIFRRRPAVAGLMIGSIAGLLVAGGYGLTSAWLCSGIRKCPASWEPFVFVSVIIFVVIVVVAVIVSILGAKAYKIFDTSIGGDKAYANAGGRGRSSESGGSSEINS
jgi:hypothetical protein|tara:strand:- start:1086 stop:1415 length:330 start_codon:yes stop_codon:yes gene_type:complete